MKMAKHKRGGLINVCEKKKGIVAEALVMGLP